MQTQLKQRVEKILEQMTSLFEDSKNEIAINISIKDFNQAQNNSMNQFQEELKKINNDLLDAQDSLEWDMKKIRNSTHRIQEPFTSLESLVKGEKNVAQVTSDLKRLKNKSESIRDKILNFNELANDHPQEGTSIINNPINNLEAAPLVHQINLDRNPIIRINRDESRFSLLNRRRIRSNDDQITDPFLNNIPINYNNIDLNADSNRQVFHRQSSILNYITSSNQINQRTNITNRIPNNLVSSRRINYEPDIHDFYFSDSDDINNFFELSEITCKNENQQNSNN